MKTLHLAGALSCALALSACQTPQSGQSVLDVIGGTSATAGQVAADIKTGCDLVVDAADLATLLTTVPYGSTAASVAKAVCTALTTKVAVSRTGAPRTAVAVVNGVTLHARRS